MRGLAVALMVADHALLAAGAGVGWRLSATRLALPLFGLVAGALCDRTSARRFGKVAGVGVVATVPGLVIGVGQPDILLLLAVTLPLVGMLPSAWVAPLGALAAVQPTTWPFAWGGYEPGVVVAALCLGRLAGVRSVSSLGARLPSSLETLGRRPLAWYLGHLVVLSAVTVVAR